jgi:hypothetical protein
LFFCLVSCLVCDSFSGTVQWIVNTTIPHFVFHFHLLVCFCCLFIHAMRLFIKY